VVQNLAFTDRAESGQQLVLLWRDPQSLKGQIAARLPRHAAPSDRDSRHLSREETLKRTLMVWS